RQEGRTNRLAGADRASVAAPDRRPLSLRERDRVRAIRETGFPHPDPLPEGEVKRSYAGVVLVLLGALPCPPGHAFVEVPLWRELPPRIEVVQPAEEIVSGPGCATYEPGNDCAFEDEFAAIEVARLRAVAGERRIGWASATDGGVCIPVALAKARAVLRFDAGELPLTGSDVPR